MSLVIPIGGWVNLSGGGGGGSEEKSLQILPRSPEVAISVIMSKSRGVLPYKSDGRARRVVVVVKMCKAWVRSTLR